MSILIKGMEMPKEGCKDCLLVKRGRVFDICPFLKREVNGNVERGGKPYDCPLVPVTPHGRLIDADELHKEAVRRSEKTGTYEWYNCTDRVISAIDIENAPTIIEAEDGE